MFVERNIVIAYKVVAPFLAWMISGVSHLPYFFHANIDLQIMDTRGSLNNIGFNHLITIGHHDVWARA